MHRPHTTQMQTPHPDQLRELHFFGFFCCINGNGNSASSFDVYSALLCTNRDKYRRRQRCAAPMHALQVLQKRLKRRGGTPPPLNTNPYTDPTHFVLTQQSTTHPHLQNGWSVGCTMQTQTAANLSDSACAASTHCPPSDATMHLAATSHCKQPIYACTTGHNDPQCTCAETPQAQPQPKQGDAPLGHAKGQLCHLSCSTKALCTA